MNASRLRLFQVVGPIYKTQPGIHFEGVRPTSSHSLPGHRRQALLKWRFVLVGLISGIAVASITVGIATWGAPPGTAAGGTIGPYLLNNSTRGVELSFPQCSLVTIHWQVMAGSSTNFSVWPPEAVLAANCHSPLPPPTNSTCPAVVCGNASMGPGPVCFESGMSGVCSFSSTQPGYGFDLYTGYHISNGTPIENGLGNTTVSFTARCSLPAIA